MENKRKIWVRVAAFMAAIVCCVICVVPAYAEGTETETAQEQEEKLNSMVGADVFRAADYVVDLDYREMKAYAVLNSNSFYLNAWYPINGVYDIAVGSAGYLYVKVIDSNGNVADEYGQVVNTISLNYSAGSSGFLRFIDNVSSRRIEIGTMRNTSTNKVSFKYVSISGRENTYYASGGYTYEGFCILNNVSPDNGMFYCFSNELYNPSQMLGFSFAGDVDEVYNRGYSAGYQFGFDEGEMFGLEEGLDLGREEGYTEGDADGYRRGYDDGMQQTSLIDGIKSLFRAPMEFVEGALNFEIFGIDLGDAVKALVSMMLLALVVTIVWKAVK